MQWILPIIDKGTLVDICAYCTPPNFNYKPLYLSKHPGNAWHDNPVLGEELGVGVVVGPCQQS